MIIESEAKKETHFEDKMEESDPLKVIEDETSKPDLMSAGSKKETPVYDPDTSTNDN